MTDHLLDSTALIDYFRRSQAIRDLLEQLENHGHQISVSTVGLVELYAGFDEQERLMANPVVDRWSYHEITPQIAKEAGRIRYEFLRRGNSLSIPDTLTAAVAIANEAILVTKNIRHFPMDGIRILRHDLDPNLRRLLLPRKRLHLIQ